MKHGWVNCCPSSFLLSCFNFGIFYLQSLIQFNVSHNTLVDDLGGKNQFIRMLETLGNSLDAKQKRVDLLLTQSLINTIKSWSTHILHVIYIYITYCFLIIKYATENIKKTIRKWKYIYYTILIEISPHISGVQFKLTLFKSQLSPQNKNLNSINII